MAQAMVLEAVQIRQLLPVRPRFSHKGDFGRVLLVCGSVGFTGAAALAARAALRTGAGLITVATPRQVWPIVAAKLDEPMVMPMAEDKAGLRWCSCLQRRTPVSSARAWAGARNWMRWSPP